MELALWSDHNLRSIHQKIDLHPILDAMNHDKNNAIKKLQKEYIMKSAVL